MTITATRETYDIAIAALERADREGRPNWAGKIQGPDGAVCACYVVAEALETDKEKVERSAYEVIHRAGLDTMVIYGANDNGNGTWDKYRKGGWPVEGGFRRAADALIAEAERVCGAAVVEAELVSA